MAELDPPLLAALLRDALRQGKEPMLTVTSDSMAPLIRRGDQIRLAAAAPTDLQPGDIIVIGGRHELLTHRYWGRLGDGPDAPLLTRGDRPRDYDPPAPVDQLVGRVVARRRAQRVLPLCSGAGEWLNGRLARLAALDAGWFAAPPALQTGTSVARQGPQGSSSLRLRLTRRAIFGVAAILADSVTFLAPRGREGRPGR